MNKKIYTEQEIYGTNWVAYDENYDGAPDAGPQFVGHGATEQEAIDDLLLQQSETNEE